MYKHASLILIPALWLVSLGCRNPLPCPDCTDEAAEADETPTPDLPCDGVDLMTDNLNCGSCGHECGLWWPDTQIAAGACVDGVCGPGWTDCVSESTPFSTCAEICELYGSTCVANGCSGYTGILKWVGLEGNCGGISSGNPDFVMTGGCDQAIPWMTNNDASLEVLCCCDFQ